MRHVVEPDAAVLFGHGSTQQTERRHLPQHVLREDLAAIALTRTWCNFLVREILRELPDRLLLGGEVEIQAPSLWCAGVRRSPPSDELARIARAIQRRRARKTRRVRPQSVI